MTLYQWAIYLGLAVEEDNEEGAKLRQFQQTVRNGMARKRNPGKKGGYLGPNKSAKLSFIAHFWQIEGEQMRSLELLKV